MNNSISSPIVSYDRSIRWRKKNGVRHRTDGPAVIYENGEQWWYINGVRYTDAKEFQLAAKISDDELTIMILKYGNITK